MLCNVLCYFLIEHKGEAFHLYPGRGIEGGLKGDAENSADPCSNLDRGISFRYIPMKDAPFQGYLNVGS